MGRPRFKPRKPGQPAVGKRRGTRTEAVKVVRQVPDDMASTDEVSELLSSLVGKEAAVRKAEPLTPEGGVPFVVCAYNDEDGEVGAALLADVTLAASLSAALTLVPAEVVGEATKRGELDDGLLENFAEIANICTQLVRLKGFPRFNLGDSHQTATGLPDEIGAFLSRAAFAAGFDVDVPGYGKGRMAVVLHRE